MENLKKGDTLKLSREGLDRIYGCASVNKFEEAKARRFEFRSFSRQLPDCVTVKLIRGGIPTYYKQYHGSFLERA